MTCVETVVALTPTQRAVKASETMKQELFGKATESKISWWQQRWCKLRWLWRNSRSNVCSKWR